MDNDTDAAEADDIGQSDDDSVSVGIDPLVRLFGWIRNRSVWLVVAIALGIAAVAVHARQSGIYATEPMPVYCSDPQPLTFGDAAQITPCDLQSARYYKQFNEYTATTAHIHSLQSLRNELGWSAVLLGLVVIMTIVVGRFTKVCFACRKRVSRKATLCPHCRTDFTLAPRSIPSASGSIPSASRSMPSRAAALVRPPLIRPLIRRLGIPALVTMIGVSLALGFVPTAASGVPVVSVFSHAAPLPSATPPKDVADRLASLDTQLAQVRQAAAAADLAAAQPLKDRQHAMDLQQQLTTAHGDRASAQSEVASAQKVIRDMDAEIAKYNTWLRDNFWYGEVDRKIVRGWIADDQAKAAAARLALAAAQERSNAAQAAIDSLTPTVKQTMATAARGAAAINAAGAAANQLSDAQIQRTKVQADWDSRHKVDVQAISTANAANADKQSAAGRRLAVAMLLLVASAAGLVTARHRRRTPRTAQETVVAK